jgi:hypothetical protein
VLGFDLSKSTPLAGRVLVEALAGQPSAAPGPVRYVRSSPANGKQTLVMYQEHGGIRYLDMGCFVTPTTRDADACR